MLTGRVLAVTVSRRKMATRFPCAVTTSHSNATYRPSADTAACIPRPGLWPPPDHTLTRTVLATDALAEPATARRAASADATDSARNVFMELTPPVASRRIELDRPRPPANQRHHRSRPR